MFYILLKTRARFYVSRFEFHLVNADGMRARQTALIFPALHHPRFSSLPFYLYSLFSSHSLIPTSSFLFLMRFHFFCCSISSAIYLSSIYYVYDILWNILLPRFDSFRASSHITHNHQISTWHWDKDAIWNIRRKYCENLMNALSKIRSHSSLRQRRVHFPRV